MTGVGVLVAAAGVRQVEAWRPAEHPAAVVCADLLGEMSPGEPLVTFRVGQR